MKPLLFLAYLVLILEGGTRALTEWKIVYDVEMVKYSHNLKVYQGDYFLHQPSTTLSLMGKTIKTNSRGLREEEYPAKKQYKGQKKRVAVLGDSLTFGWGVEQDKTFAHLLKDHFKGQAEFFNLGHPNTNTSQQQKIFDHFHEIYGFDHLVLFYFLNDAEEVKTDGQIPLWTYSRFLVLLKSRLRALTSEVSFIDYYNKLHKGESWEEQKKVLRDFSSNLKERGVKLSVVILPDFHQLRPYPFREIHQKLRDFFKEQSIEALDLMEDFNSVEEARALWVADDDPHPNTLAHKIIFEKSREFVTERITERGKP